MRWYPLLVFCVLVGCGAEPLALPQRPTLRIPGTLPAPTRPASTLYRDEVVRAVQDGLGHFLQLVALRPVIQQDDVGRRVFVGFEVVSLRPAMQWLPFDFAPGDILTRLDGVSVEHYDSVIPVFEGLVNKDRFEVSLIRSGQPKTVIVSIVDRQPSQGPRSKLGAH